MTEESVREMLQRRAGDVIPSPAAWAEIETRLGGDGDAQVLPLVPRRARRLPPMLVAAAVLVAVGLAALVVTRPDGDQRVTTSPADTAVTSTTAPGPVGVGDAEIPSLWPATTTAGLLALQADADAGRRPDLLDPRAAAGQYLSDRFLAVPGRRVDFEVREYRAGDSMSGEVPYVADRLPGSVLVSRLGGGDGIWYVSALTALGLPTMDVVYDGARLTADIRPTVAGQLEVEVSGPKGGDRIGESGRAVQAGELVRLDTPFRDNVAAIALLRLTSTDGTVSLSEIRSDRRTSTKVEATPYSYCKTRYDVSGERPESYVGSDEHLADIGRLLDAAPPAVVADLGAYRAFVADDVSPGDPASQETANWPAAIRERIQRIDAHDQRVCAAWESP